MPPCGSAEKGTIQSSQQYLHATVNYQVAMQAPIVRFTLIFLSPLMPIVVHVLIDNHPPPFYCLFRIQRGP